MRSSFSFQPENHPSALPSLFARFMAGQITESAWSRFMQVFDAADATPEEREALAEFYHDALQELGSEAVPMPKAEEAQDLLLEIRHS